MSRWHINGNTKPGECNADPIEKCPYYGYFGNDNHYATEKEARDHAEKFNKAVHGSTMSVRKSPSRSENLNTVKKALASVGIPEGDLNKHKTVSSIVKTFFHGDKS